MGRCVLCWGLVVVSAVVSVAVRGEDADREGLRPVYRCPGPPVRYTDDVSPGDAKTLGCRVVEGAPITSIRGSPFAGPRARAAESGYVDKYVMYTAGMQIVRCRKDAAASACKGAKCGS